MRVQLVDGIVARVVESQNNVALNAIGVVDEEIRDGSTVGDELCADSLGGDGVLPVGVLCAGRREQQ